MTRPVRTVLSVLLGLVLLAGSGTVAFTQEATPEISVKSSVAYGDAGGEELLLDVYQPPVSAGTSPAVVLFPCWTCGRVSMTGVALELARAGYVAFAVDYREDWPEHIDDAQLAVRWIRANADDYGVDPDRICSYGHSTGGQLAAMVGVRDTRDDADPALAEYSSRVACAIDVAGENDMTIPYPDDFWNTWLVDMLGGTLDEAPDRYRDVSPVAFVDDQSAPFLIIQGAEDTTISIEHARRMAEALQAAGVEVVSAELAGEDHFSVAEWSESGDLTLAFLERHLHP